MFDPYRKWLGILPKDQPPNHYRLLSLELFEADLDVIEGAAERQMGFVRQYQSGDQAADAARILNELATARLCLLKPATKAAYDAKLRTELAAAAEPEPAPDFPDLPMSDESPNALRSRSKRKKKSGQSRSDGPSPQWMIGGGIGAAVCVLLIIFLFSGRGHRPVAKPPESNSVAVTTPDKLPDTKVPATSTGPTDAAAKAVAWSDSKLATEPAGEPVDLLKMVDLERDVAVGKCEKTSSALILDRGSRVYLPSALPDDYQLKFSIRRIEGADSLKLGFVMGGRQGVVVIDGWHATLSGLYVDGREANDNSTTRRGKLFEGASTATIVVTVHPGHFHATFDGKTIINWFGNSERMYLHSGHLQIGSRETPFIGTVETKYAIESASMVPLKPEPAPVRVARLDREVDVLPLIDTDRDAQRGIWALSKNALSSPEGWGKLYLPTVVPEEYTVSATVELPAESQGDYALTVGLIAEKSYFQLTSTRGGTGLDMIDGRRFDNNEARLAGPLLKPGIPTRIACTVTKTGIRMDADGKTLIDWRGDVRRLSVPGDWALPDGRRLYLGSIGHLKFRDIKLGPPLPAPKTPDHPPLTVGKPLDVLSLIDPARDVRSGTWDRDGSSLRSRGDVDSNRLVIPVDVPDDYKFTMKVARIEGGYQKDECLFVGLPFVDSKALVTIDENNSKSSGVYLDFEGAKAQRVGTVIPLGVSRELVFVVGKTGLKVTSDGETIIDWTGNPARFSFHSNFATPGRRVAIGGWHTGFRFEKLELEALPPTSVPPVAAPGSDGKLMSVINVDRDTRRGNWKLEGDALTGRTKSAARLTLPVPVPERYVLSALVERIEGSRQLNLGLIVGGKPCMVVIDADGQQNAGIDLLDGKRYFDDVNLVRRNYKTPLLPSNQRVPVRCLVLPDTIVVTCGDKEVIRWHGDPRRLSILGDLIPPNESEADRTHLWLGGWESGFVFRDLELKPLTDTEAEQLSKSFAGVFPTAPQKDVPFTTTQARVDTKDAPPANSLPTNPVSTPSVSPQSSQPAKLGEWTDLLEWAVGVDWAPRGINWNDNIEGKAARGGIKMKSAPAMRFPLPAIIDGDYEMEIEFRRAKGEEAVAIYFPVGIHTMRLLLGTDTGKVSHVSFVDEKEFGERRPAPITNDQPHRVVIRVRRDGNKAGFNIDWDNVKDYIQWEGADTALRNTDGSNWRTTMIGHPWIGGWNSDVTVQKVRVRMISGTIRRDSITDADREQDLKDGFVRLVGEKASGTLTGAWPFVVNQLPLELGAGGVESMWPMIARDFKVCDDFYGAHAPSRLKCPIPPGAKSFSVIGYNGASRTAKYQLQIDGKQVYDSGVTGVAVIKVDIPFKSTVLELIVDPAGNNEYDHTYWCFPRFHSIPSERVSERMLDGKPGPLRFSIVSSTANSDLTHNKPIGSFKSVPIHFNDVVPCDEFLFAHAPSTATYQVPEGMTRFTAIGVNVLSHHVKYQVWSGVKRIYESPEAGIIPIDVKLPIGTKTIELKVDHLGSLPGDHSMWCYPRLHRK